MSKGDIYGADEIETEEQALEEEAEALRLQKKQLQSMTAADYGFDESEWQDGGAEKDDDNQDADNVVTEVLPQLQISQDMSSAERLKLLKTRYPEFEPLSKELLSLRDTHARLVVESQKNAVHASPDYYPNLITKLRAASAYVGVLAMYFALLTSPANVEPEGVIAMPAAQLRDHPVMDSLVKCRELWLRAKSLPEDLLPRTNNASDREIANGHHVELETKPQSRPRQGRLVQKSRAERHAEAAKAEAEKRKAERLQKTEAGLAELDALIAPVRSKKSRKASGRDVNESTDFDFDEEAALTAHEAAEKAKRKKSLRFYTSQIAQKANKRGVAGRNAGGDDDIPYRERLKDRQARLNAQAERRGQPNANPGADLGGESEEEDARQARQIRGEEDNDYYDLIASRTARKKSDKAALAEAQRQAALQGGQVTQEAVIGPDGKRKITYAIEKNKGLTPHRKKEVRNPRVKKRKKFDEKKKKLGSIKPVYKGGEGRGGYGGELTGIKKGLVKSTKL
jgi:U3 small nucleolar RNA-associated protein 3